MFNQVVQSTLSSTQLGSYSNTPTQLPKLKSSPIQNQHTIKPILKKNFTPYQHYSFGQSNNISQLLYGNPFQKVHLTQRTNDLYSQLQLCEPTSRFLNRSEINYQDDDEIQISNHMKQPTYDLEKNLHFEVKSQKSMVSLLEGKQLQMPAIVSLQTKENAKSISERAGVDLICLIDVSSSMAGLKIEMVQKALIQLLDFLESSDRLQLITFETDAERLTPLKKASQVNKQYFKTILNSLLAGGSTNIAEATELAFNQIRKRKYRNNVTSIFLLSDGQDPQALPRIVQQIKQCDQVFTLHTFGFGDDHDAELMTSICNLGMGSFYFVQEISLLDEFFADALGGLISVIGEEIEINLRCRPTQPYQDTQIIKTYGGMWRCQRAHRDYSIKIPLITCGSRKDFVFKLEFPQLNKQFKESTQATIIEAQLSLKNPITKQIMRKKASLIITFNNSDEQIQANYEDSDVMAQYYRVKAADVIDDARRACEKEQFKEAQLMIETMLSIIQRNKQTARLSAGVIQDLQQAKSGSYAQSYNGYGKSQMRQIVFNSYQQSGVNAQFSEQGKQIQSEHLPTYSNSIQTTLVKSIQNSKRRTKH